MFHFLEGCCYVYRFLSSMTLHPSLFKTTKCQKTKEQASLVFLSSGKHFQPKRK